MAHAVLSPKGGPSDVAANAAEDCRILHYLLAPQMAATIRHEMGGGYMRFSTGHPAEPTLPAAIGMLGHAIAHNDRTWLQTYAPALWGEVMLVGALVEPRVWHPEKGWWKHHPSPADAAKLAAAIRIVLQDGAGADGQPLPMPKHLPAAQWAPMRILGGGRRPGRSGKRCAEEGISIENAMRAITGQGVFQAPTPITTRGTTLVDISSSMRWQEQGGDPWHRLLTSVVGIPTLAIYGGSTRTRSGRLVVNPMGFEITCDENLIDGPALEWLATQPPPRTWISDGIVTGILGRRGEIGVSPALTLEVRRLLKQHHITHRWYR